MADSVEYRIFLDTILNVRNKVKLNTGDSILLQVSAYGITVRLEADQVAFHPHNTRVSVTIENCNFGTSGIVSTGMINQFPLNDEEAGRDMDCLLITGPFDPNDKQVSPVGVGREHLTPRGTMFDYQIRFQNTGNDTAFKVVLIDTLSPLLDISTLQPGVSSHVYETDLSGRGAPVLTFTFNNIHLPDSTTDNLESQGFVKFRIAAFDTLPDRTAVENFADIYFDFNEPVRTNTVVNLISDELIEEITPSVAQVCGSGVTAAAAGRDTILCESSEIQLQGNHPAFGHGRWSLEQGAGLISDARDPVPFISDIGYGENIFRWTITLCDSISYQDVVVIRKETLTPEIIPLGDSLYCSLDGSIYEWYWNGEPLNINSRTILPELPGIYTVVAIEKFCPSDTSLPFVFVGMPVRHLPAFTVYPNPSSGILNMSSSQPGDYNLNVMNILGEVVFQKQISITGPFLAEQIDLSSLGGGIYILKATSKGVSVQHKLVIHP